MKNAREINGVRVLDTIDRFVIDNLLFYPNNKIDNICGYINLFLHSGCSYFNFNIEGNRKIISISKVKELCTDMDTVYQFTYHNKFNGSRLYYQRFVTRNCIVDLFEDILEILKANK